MVFTGLSELKRETLNRDIMNMINLTLVKCTRVVVFAALESRLTNGKLCLKLVTMMASIGYSLHSPE
jgi:hypothetical protein